MVEKEWRIIAFTGPKTCGKDTMSKALLRQNKNSVLDKEFPFFAHTPFALGVKTICHQVFGWSFENMEQAVFKETVLEEWPMCEPRWPMMDIANWMRDKYGPDVWVRTLARRLETFEAVDPHGAYVITDLRFPNEIEWLKKQGALILYVERDEAEEKLAKAKAAGDAKALNQSEAHYDLMRKEADYIVDNNQEIHHAQKDVMNLIRKRFGHWVHWGIRAK